MGNPDALVLGGRGVTPTMRRQTVGDEYEVNIAEYSRRSNDGVTRIQGFVVFVHNTKPGDKVRIRIKSIGSHSATAEVV
ncbi:MAG: TRAM domain-containing protein [Candidatus Bathyarchaeia archaeon]